MLPPQLYLHTYAAKVGEWVKRRNINQDNSNLWKPLTRSYTILTTLKFSISKNVDIQRLRFFSTKEVIIVDCRNILKKLCHTRNTLVQSSGQEVSGRLQ